MIERDRQRCLCCGSVQALQIDHIKPRRHWGEDTIDNLQTLCRLCNVGKRTREINFRGTKSCRTVEDSYFPLLRPPLEKAPPDAKDDWAQYIQRTINLFYYCSAVESLSILNQHGLYEKIWQITLRTGNDPHLIKHQLVKLQQRVCWAFEYYEQQAPEQMAVTLPNEITVISTKLFEKLTVPDFSL